jgi:hypothetical protein
MGAILELRLSFPDGEISTSQLGDLLAQLGEHGRVESNALYFRDPVRAAEAAAEATRRGLKPERFYNFVVHPNEIHDYPGYYLSLDLTESLTRNGRPLLSILAKVDIAKDFDSEAIWVRESVRVLFEKTTEGITTSSVSGSDWHVITSWPDLPGPIWIPRALFVSPNEHPRRTYVVQSDGRDCLSDSDARFLQQHGPCRSTTIATEGATYEVRPRYLISPKLLEDLREARVRGLAETLVPLIDKSTALLLEGQRPE